MVARSKPIQTATPRGYIPQRRGCPYVDAQLLPKLHISIADVTSAIRLDKNLNGFRLAGMAPPLSVTDSAMAAFRGDTDGITAVLQ